MELRLTNAPWPKENRGEQQQFPWSNDRTLHSTHRSLLDRIYRLQQWKGYAWIGRFELASQCGLHPGHLTRVLRQCRAAGWLAYVPGRGRTTTLYRVVARSMSLSEAGTAVAQAESALAGVRRPGHDPLPNSASDSSLCITGAQDDHVAPARYVRPSAGATSDLAPALAVRERKSPLGAFSSLPTSPPGRQRRPARPTDRAQGDLFRGDAFDPFRNRTHIWQSDSDVGEALRRASGERQGLIVEIEGQEWFVRQVSFNGVLVRLSLAWGSDATSVELAYRQLEQIRFWRATRSKPS